MEFTPKLSTREQTMRIYAIYANRILQVLVLLTLFTQENKVESAIAVQELTFMIVNQKNNIYSRCITIYP